MASPTANTISASSTRAASAWRRIIAESYKWFALAANQGDQDAAKKRDEVAAHLDPQSLAAAQLAVKTWTAGAAARRCDQRQSAARRLGCDASAAAAVEAETAPGGGKTPAPDAKAN